MKSIAGQITSIILLFAIFMQLFSKAIIITEYYLNKDYIAQNLCENKDKPQKHCEGKCHLQKQLKEDEKKEQTPPFRNFKDKNEIQFFNSIDCFSILNTSSPTALFICCLIPKLQSPSFSIFHPPKC